MENKLNINDALSFLKKYYVLFSDINNEKIYFLYRDNHILIRTPKASFKLNENDFLLLYKNTKFSFNNVNEISEIDVEKDKEYYSWKQ